LPLTGPYLRGPFHALTEDLDLGGVIWGALPGYALPGRVLLSIGDTALLTVADGPVVHLHWLPAASNLQRTPDWPILIDNLLAWRATRLPEAQPRNVPLGARLSWEHAADRPVSVLAPDGRRIQPALRGGLAEVALEWPGRYRLEIGGRDGQIFDVAANLLAATESDLRGRGACEHGLRGAAVAGERFHRSLVWPLLLAGVAALALHHLLCGAPRHAGPEGAP
jgi:hypothetical protein